MLRSIKELLGYAIRARDGNIGKVHDFFFDDQFWTVRYLVINTGKWLPGRRVLVSPIAFGEPDWATQVLHVKLTKEMVEKTPDVDTDKPVSRQKEIDLHEHFGWPYYWSGDVYWGGGVSTMAGRDDIAREPLTESKAVLTEKSVGDPNLRSIREVRDYHIQASDGEIGHVDDFIVDDKMWIIRYTVVDTRNWWPGKEGTAGGTVDQRSELDRVECLL